MNKIKPYILPLFITVVIFITVLIVPSEILKYLDKSIFAKTYYENSKAISSLDLSKSDKIERMSSRRMGINKTLEVQNFINFDKKQKEQVLNFMYSEINKMKEYDVDIVNYLPKNINECNVDIEFISILDRNKLLTDFYVWKVIYKGDKEEFWVSFDFEEGTIYEFGLYGEEIAKDINKEHIKNYIYGYTKYLGFNDVNIYESENMFKANINSLNNVNIEYIHEDGVFMNLRSNMLKDETKIIQK